MKRACLSAILFCVTACTASTVPSSERADTSEQESVAANPSEQASGAICQNRQITQRAAKGVTSATYKKFLSRNAGQWNPSSPDWTGDRITGAIGSSYRTDPIGPALPVVEKADATKTARDFIVANWDLVGFRARATAVGAQVTATATDASYSGGGYAWSVRVSADEPQPGYEGIEGAAQHLEFIVDVAVDGTVRQFTAVNRELRPWLTLSTTPAVNVATARTKVIGTHLRRAPTEMELGTTIDYGVVTASDIVKESLVVYPVWNDADPNDTSIEIRLAHKLTVERQGARAVFSVDTCSGESLGHYFEGPNPFKFTL